MTVTPKPTYRMFRQSAALGVVLVLLASQVGWAQTTPRPFPVSASISFQDQPSTPVTSDIPVREVNNVQEPQTGTIIPVVDKTTAQEVGTDIITTSCPGCNSITSPTLPSDYPGGNGHTPLFMGCDCCRPGGGCFPGQKPCHPCDHYETTIGRFACGLYDCLCCPNPCYEGKWTPIADSAFFVQAPRPVTQQRIRWDAGFDLILPDRSEYFWARADGNGRGPKPTAPALAIPRLDYNELSLYTEVALEKIGMIVVMPYRTVDPDGAPFHANFGDTSIATKTLLFDCALLQVAYQMTTHIPVGSAGKGLGTGHVSLEHSLLFGIRLHEEGYFQGELSEWIPIGGDQHYPGAIFHYHFSLNQTLYRPLPDVPIIGTLECSGYRFQDGAYTDPVFGGFQQSSGYTYFHVGAGLRMFVCDRIDIGMGFQVPLTSQHWASQLYRTEFRWRY